jgi:hypothetical protein
MVEMNKIKYVSLFFKLLFQIIFICLLIMQVIGWVYAPIDSWFNVIPRVYQASIANNFDLNTKIAGFVVTMVPTAIKLMVLYFLIKLFALYERHEFFSENNVRYIRNAGYALFLEQIIRPISDFILGFVLTSGNPPGLRYATMIITGTNLGLMLTALVIILISWIMTEGAKLHDEQQLTI